MKDISISMICDVTWTLQIDMLLKFRHTHKQSKWLPFTYIYSICIYYIFFLDTMKNL